MFDPSELFGPTFVVNSRRIGFFFNQKQCNQTVDDVVVLCTVYIRELITGDKQINTRTFTYALIIRCDRKVGRVMGNGPN